ncbi:MAG TPA: alpha/beta fold hydrolase, partial [Thermodesulfobacteriota bacterium]|nr:alpha/beta fold hydrolase [Thermodesulfobacteriota bacterium]
MELPFLFNNEGLDLYGVLNIPDSKELSNRKGIVFCGPFAEERNNSYRSFVNFARLLCKCGYTILRFDYRGYGDSGGDFEDATFHTQIKDIRRAMDLLQEKEQVNEIGLLGLRLGGTLAMLTAEVDERVKFLILWSPIGDPLRYLQNFLRSKMITEIWRVGQAKKSVEDLFVDLQKGEEVDVKGYLIRKDLYNDFIRYKSLLEELKDFQGKVLIVQIYKDNKIDLIGYRYKDIGASSELLFIPEEPFWDRDGSRSGDRQILY